MKDIEYSRNHTVFSLTQTYQVRLGKRCTVVIIYIYNPKVTGAGPFEEDKRWPRLKKNSLTVKKNCKIKCCMCFMFIEDHIFLSWCRIYSIIENASGTSLKSIHLPPFRSCLNFLDEYR